MSEEAFHHELADPRSFGWLKIRPRTWELPDGSIYEFPPNVQEMLHVRKPLAK